MVKLKVAGLLALVSSMLMAACGSPDDYAPPGKMPCSFEGNDFHREVIVDDTFLPEELSLINIAFDKWNSETNGVVTYTIVGKFTHDDTPSFYPLHSDKCTIFIHRGVPGQYSSLHVEALGAGSENTIALIPGNLYSRESWVEVVMHETGHTLGLVHVPQRSAIMYPTCAGRCSDPYTTQIDLDQLCDLIKLTEAKPTLCDGTAR